MRRIVVGLCLCAAMGCGGDQAGSSSHAAASGAKNGQGAKTHILCSFFPMYLFTKNVVGDAPGVEVSLMLPASQGCPHAYDLTPADAKKIAAADVFVLNGAGLEEFDEKKIKAQNAKVAIIDTTKGLKLISADEHDHEHGPGHHHDSDKNPHCFASPNLAAGQVRNIAEGLAAYDAKNAETYRKNANAYAARLEGVGKEFTNDLSKLSNKKIVTMHEVFDYLAKDCGIDIVGEIHTGTGVEAVVQRKLIDKIKAEKVPAVFKEPQFAERSADAIAKEAGVPVLLLDPVASGPDDAPLDYYEKTMRQNLATLVKAFGGKP
jgi:ABC-type Zn uptake system ZnuABC Zn-binding protein ZnuA